MKIADATLDRIQRRREKLERTGAIAPDIESLERASLHLWHIDEGGFVVPSCEHTGNGIDIVALPAGKFMPVPERVLNAAGQLIDGPTPLLFQTPEMWAEDCRVSLMLPDRRIRLIDAPEPPEFTESAIERVPDARIGAQDAQSTEERPLAIRPEDIDRKAVLIDLAKHRRERIADATEDNVADNPASQSAKRKARTYEERYNQMQAELAETFERQRLEQQKIAARPASPMAMAPTIGTGWKGH